jgi:hypothetical protein
MKKNATSKIFASIALFWIIIWIVGTAILFIVQWWATPQQPVQQLTEEEIQKLIEESGLNLDQTGTWESIEVDALDPAVLDATTENTDWEVIQTEWEETLIQE